MDERTLKEQDTELMKNAIIREYNGKNILELAKKYDYSERSIWRIIKTSNTK